jgi:hypothetical protein
MKKSELIQKIKEVLAEMSTTGTGASFSPGSGEQYATPFAFSKKGQGKNAATKQGERLGLKVIKRPKHPSHTKMFDYLNERGAGHYVTPNAFTSEAGMYDQDAVKYSEQIGMEVVNKPKNPSKKTLETYSDHKEK